MAALGQDHSRKGKENPLFQGPGLPESLCPTRGQWHNDYTVDFKMAYDHYFGKGKADPRIHSAIQVFGARCFKNQPG
jgi:hypothetical protein